MSQENSVVNEALSDVSLQNVYDIPLQVSAVLGRAEMKVSQLVKLSRGTVIELDRKVGEAIDLYVNERIVAKGEIVLVDGIIGITITELVANSV